MGPIIPILVGSIKDRYKLLLNIGYLLEKRDKKQSITYIYIYQILL